jgi:hypothetical protein
MNNILSRLVSDGGVDVGVKATILKEKTVLNREKKSKLTVCALYLNTEKKNYHHY